MTMPRVLLIGAHEEFQRSLQASPALDVIITDPDTTASDDLARESALPVL